VRGECTESVTLTCEAECIATAEWEGRVCEGDPPAPEPEVEEAGTQLRHGCLATPAPVDDAGAFACVLYEVTPTSASCDCGVAGRRPVEGQELEDVRTGLSSSGICADASCASMCACELIEADGAALSSCQQDAEAPASGSGFCYVDGEAGVGSPDLVQECAMGQRRILRFADPPRPGMVVWTPCVF
ncbi:MAG TPA: hypothetical protein VHO25_05610, partial [Polyangiaceae bacterium]|nr:hypothetical protein [Polyangiaceae bacterium]